MSINTLHKGDDDDDDDDDDNNNNVYSIIVTVYYREIRDISVSTVTRLRSLRSGVRIPAEQRNFIFSKMSRPNLGAHPTSHSTCIGILSRGQSGRGVMLTHSPVPTAEVQKESSKTSTLPTCLQGTDRAPLPLPSALFKLKPSAL